MVYEPCSDEQLFVTLLLRIGIYFGRNVPVRDVYLIEKASEYHIFVFLVCSNIHEGKQETNYLPFKKKARDTKRNGMLLEIKPFKTLSVLSLLFKEVK